MQIVKVNKYQGARKPGLDWIINVKKGCECEWEGKSKEEVTKNRQGIINNNKQTRNKSITPQTSPNRTGPF